MHRVTGVLACLCLLTVAGGCQRDQLQGAKAEVQKTSIKLDLPPVPDFVMPQPNADGTHSVAEMRLKGKKFLDTEVKVKGYVVWIYDCATAIRTPEMTDKELAKILEDQPERCSRPHFTIADKPDTSPDRGIWVVDVPRPLRKDDKNLPKEIYAQMKADWKALPPFKVGDQLVVDGTWALVSPKGFRHSDGLLVYKSMQAVGGAAGGDGQAPGAPQK